MTNLCDVCGKPATQSMLRDLFGKSDAMRFVCSDHGFRIRDPADVAEIERLQKQIEILQRANRFLSEQIPSAHEPERASVTTTITIPDFPENERGYRLSAERISQLIAEYVRYRRDGQIPQPYIDIVSALSELAAYRARKLENEQLLNEFYRYSTVDYLDDEKQTLRQFAQWLDQRGSHEPGVQLPVIENWAAFARESKDPAVRNMYADFKAVLEGASRDASSLHEKNIAKFNALKSGEGQ